MSKHFQTELDTLKGKLLTLSARVEEALSKATRAVAERNELLATEVVREDREIDKLEVTVEEECLKILALHQPVASDLRYIVATLKINNDLERIADLAVNIADRAVDISKFAPINAPFDFSTMSQITLKMLNMALESLIRLDADMAKKVRLEDDRVDEINREMYSKVVDRIRENVHESEVLIQYLSVSKHLERIADYTTNIAEDVIYMAEGEIVRHSDQSRAETLGKKNN